ncbi:MAG: hypothetical protein ACFB0E_20845 [Leptolyngbyaceae cyanobacterium]
MPIPEAFWYELTARPGQAVKLCLLRIFLEGKDAPDGFEKIGIFFHFRLNQLNSISVCFSRVKDIETEGAGMKTVSHP